MTHILLAAAQSATFNHTLFGFILLLVVRNIIGFAIILVLGWGGTLLAAAIDKVWLAAVGWVVAILALIVWEVYAWFNIVGDFIWLIKH